MGGGGESLAAEVEAMPRLGVDGGAERGVQAPRRKILMQVMLAAH